MWEIFPLTFRHGSGSGNLAELQARQQRKQNRDTHRHPVPPAVGNERQWTMLQTIGSTPRSPRSTAIHPKPLGDAATAARTKIRNEQTGQEIDLRQLRHHTKNTLQRIIALVIGFPRLHDPGAGEKLAQELEYRITLSATISNALFGLTEAPGSMANRLRQLGGAIVDMMRDREQVIRVGVSVSGTCPAELREAVIRSANELIGNAVKHGMRNRPQGRIAVRLTSKAGMTVLTVTDDGCGLSGTQAAGEGLSLVRSFAARHGGRLRLEHAGKTVAIMKLPHPASGPGASPSGRETRRDRQS
jgi:two-component sensor histidine kinase